MDDLDIREKTGQRPDIREKIGQKLDEIEQAENVRILYAVESGSRSWGFASPDSDYDVRFIYVRTLEDYLRLDQKRDVIEWQLDEVLDINGWDLQKVLRQFHKSNATVFEWSNSPIVYRTSEAWDAIYQAAKGYFSPKSVLYHYYGTAKSTYCQFLQGEQVRYKKYFYALRPLLSCCYIREHGCPPPIAFDELMKTELPQELRAKIVHLLELKKGMGEKEQRPQLPVIRNFILAQLDEQKAYAEALEAEPPKGWDVLNAVFCETVKKSVL